MIKKIVVIALSIFGTIALLFSLLDSNKSTAMLSLFFFSLAILEEKTDLIVIKIAARSTLTITIFIIGIISYQLSTVYKSTGQNSFERSNYNDVNSQNNQHQIQNNGLSQSNQNQSTETDQNSMRNFDVLIPNNSETQDTEGSYNNQNGINRKPEHRQYKKSQIQFY